MRLSSLFTSFVYLGIASATLLNLQSSASIAKKLINGNQFDYIIVGGGTTGLTLARRLSDDPKVKVLVLEAGQSGVGNPTVTVPEKSFSFIATGIDWLYSTSPQVHANNLEINLSQGKVLGGDSAVNGLVWSRPFKTDWDDFENMGNPGWNWKNLYTAARKSEKVNIPQAQFAREYGYKVNPASHGTSGPVQASFPPFIPPQHLKFINASIELGHEFNTDPYAGDNVGVWFGLSSQTSQNSRETSEFAYFDPVLNRQNLIVCSYAFVTKLNLSDASRGLVQSTGVQIRFPDGSVVTAKPNKSGEVIMTAGSVRTPQLLELSGIGNKSILQKHKIPVKVDLPGVGENYEDHTLTILTYKLKPGYLSFDALGYNSTLAAEAPTKITFTQGVLNFAPAQSILSAADMQTAKKLLQTKPPSTPQQSFNLIKNKVFSGVPQAEYILFNSFSGGPVKEPNTSYISMAVTHLHPLSRGSIHINTTSIDDHPIINPNVLESDWDSWFLAKATAYGRKFFETEAFKEIFEPAEVFPGLQTQTQADWEDFITKNVNIGYHSVGTASLMPRNKNGVVDTNLKVYGTSNIRVADVSVMPLLVSAHTQTTAYAIAERAAQLIQSS
ncbi:hypothetical protein NP233_g6822 [Leucocoprinus birnbaumii]|uniref:pyranose dehydrogenase (acceptor) n=1 Tax=Leucocoprinus birnbaumii TaxID=56174 RepID=A0AAD5VQB7_9AGAR|nr:hypothetical protein NP233_g6822 [Leucocoprinus birnbaumii]